MTGSPQKSSFPVVILRTRAPAAQKKQFACFECCPVAKVARFMRNELACFASVSLNRPLFNHRLGGGWSCKLTWVASDACYEVAAFWARKKTALFKFP